MASVFGGAEIKRQLNRASGVGKGNHAARDCSMGSEILKPNDGNFVPYLCGHTHPLLGKTLRKDDEVETDKPRTKVIVIDDGGSGYCSSEFSSDSDDSDLFMIDHNCELCCPSTDVLNHDHLDGRAQFQAFPETYLKYLGKITKPECLTDYQYESISSALEAELSVIDSYVSEWDEDAKIFDEALKRILNLQMRLRFDESPDQSLGRSLLARKLEQFK